MGQVLTAGPHEVLVVSGGCTQGAKTYTVGGWAWAWWVLSDHQKMSLEIMTLEPKCEDVETQRFPNVIQHPNGNGQHGLTYRMHVSYLFHYELLGGC